MIKYIKFQSSCDKVNSEDCTTRWPDTIQCSIHMSGIYQNKYTNLMIMIGDEIEIDSWVLENQNKVVELSESECNAIGQEMSPEGMVNIVMEEEDCKIFEKTFTAGLFTMTEGQIWILTNNVEITP